MLRLGQNNTVLSLHDSLNGIAQVEWHNDIISFRSFWNSLDWKQLYIQTWSRSYTLILFPYPVFHKNRILYSTHTLDTQKSNLKRVFTGNRENEVSNKLGKKSREN